MKAGSRARRRPFESIRRQLENYRQGICPCPRTGNLVRGKEKLFSFQIVEETTISDARERTDPDLLTKEREKRKTEQEQQLISVLAERNTNAPPPQVDRDADELIRRTIGARPDALYILTQTVLVQEMALNQAKAPQLEQMRQQGVPQQQGSFLQPGSYQGGYPPPPRYQDSGYAPPPPPPSGGGFSGFLHNAATTAAGVIAGKLRSTASHRYSAITAGAVLALAAAFWWWWRHFAGVGDDHQQLRR